MKSDYVRRIDQRTGAGPGHRAALMPVSSGSGLPYSAAIRPAPLTIPVSAGDGYLDPGWLRDYALSSGNGDSSSGQTYIAPWVRLLQPLAAGSDRIVVAGNGLEVGDNVAISHASRFVERAKVIGGPVSAGEWWEYTLSRPNEQTDYPSGAQVYNLGQDADGGFVTVVSGDQADHLQAPHINLWAYEEGEVVRKVRLGLLSGLSAEEKALFPAVTDWNRYSLFADDAFLKGQINATSGNITGDLDVSGTLGVWSGLGRAGVVMGQSEGGHGIVLQNKEGRPVFAAISPYEDETGTLNEVALYIEHEGKRGLYYHKDSTTGEYRLDIAVDTLVDGTLTASNILAGTGTYPGGFTGMRFGAEGLQSYGTDFLVQVALDVQDGRLYFGGGEGYLYEKGMAIDTTIFQSGIDELEHTIHWIHTTGSTASGDYIGASLGSDDGQLFATVRRLKSDLIPGTPADNSFYQSKLMMEPGPQNTTYLHGQNVELRGDLSAALSAGDTVIPVKAILTPDGRFTTNRLTVGGSALHVTDDGQTVSVGTNSATSARLISQADDMANFKALRSDGQYFSIEVLRDSVTRIGATGNIAIAPAPGADGVGRILPWSNPVGIGTASRKFWEVYAEKGHFGALGSQTALAGQFYLTHKHMTLRVGLEADNVETYAAEGDLAIGEFYRFEDVDGNYETVRINTTGTLTGDGWYFYEIERAQGADVDNGLGLARLWEVGDVGVSLGGNATDGYIRLFGADDLNPNTGPAIVIMQRDNDDAPASVSERAVFGNLNGWYGYATNQYGVAFGQHAGRWVSLDENEGLRIMEGDAQQAVYREYVQIGRPTGNNVFITNSTLQLGTGSTYTISMDVSGDISMSGQIFMTDDIGIYFGDDTSAYTRFTIGELRVGDGSNYETVIHVDSIGLYHNANNEILINADGLSYFKSNFGTALSVHGIGGDGLRGYSDTGIAITGSASDESGIGILANGSGNAASIALQISGGIVDGGSQRYTNLADATAATDALNRQTGDGRYCLQSTGYLKADGTTTGATSQAQTFTYGLVVNEGGNDSDTRMEGDTATNLFVLDAGLDAVQIGTTSAGVIADFRTGGIVFNEDGTDRDIRFEGDTDVNLLYLDAGNNRVGVGTASPSAPLHVYQANSNTPKTDMLYLSVADTSGAGLVDYFIFKLGATNARGGSVVFGETGGGFGESGIDWNLNLTKIYQYGSYPIVLYTNGSERVRIDGSGYVGIATSSPSTYLDVNADKFRVRTAKTPASASATGNAGDICWDSSYIYVCTASNTWVRAALSTW